MNTIREILSSLNLNFSSISRPDINFTTLIDIFLVAFIIYNVLIWIKESRAWSLLKGIIIVMFISLLSIIFNLYTISWIIRGTFNAGVIAVIVLFTPEIRKALEQIGSNSKMNLFGNTVLEDKQISSHSLDSLIRACNKMASVRTGAIIVIENKTPIGDIAETGIIIDGKISTQLIINIFEDKTPLHDGAIVVRQNRVAAACCILPLTEKEIGKELGTRHRAAVGVSEISDAFVIVVSEETGFISLAHDGKLYKHIDENKLRKMIIFNNVENSKKTFKRKGGEKNE